MSIDLALWFATIAMEAVTVALLLRRHIHRLLPVFCLFITWTILSDAAMMLVRQRYPADFLRVYFIETGLDSGWQFAVLLELAWSVLRPFRASLPKGTIFAIGGIILLAGAAVWPFAGSSVGPTWPLQWHLLFRTTQTVSILRILFFLILAGFSQLLAIGWRNREMQVATGLGFYSLVSLGGSLFQAHHTSVSQYQNVDRAVAVSYFLSLSYWVFSFSQQDVPRQEFSPRMQSLLLSIAGTARSARVTLEDPRFRDGPGRPK